MVTYLIYLTLMLCYIYLSDVTLNNPTHRHTRIGCNYYENLINLLSYCLTKY